MARIKSSGAPLLGVVTNAMKPEQQENAYAYGYAATYAHYAYTDDSDSVESKKTLAPPFHSWLRVIQERRRQFMRWIDS